MTDDTDGARRRTSQLWAWAPGLLIGMVIGLMMFDWQPIGVAFGISIGIAFALALGAASRRSG